MPIIRLGTLADKAKPNFAVVCEAGRVLDSEYSAKRYDLEIGSELQGPFIAYCTYQSHHGLCIRDFERNGYDDSDWYMIVWNAEKHEPETIEFASTRGWSYPCYSSSPDASPETKAEYANWEFAQSWFADKKAVTAKAKALQAFRADCRTIAHNVGVPVSKLYQLSRTNRAFTWARVASMARLYGAGIRSEFKKSLRNQIAAWLRDPSPKYSTPLSAKQMEWL